MSDLTLPLERGDFTAQERLLAQTEDFRVVTFAYPSGVEALRLENARGQVTLLPYLGQMVWDAEFDGRQLTMGHVFPYPRRGASILDTYGAFAYHAGILRNGTPGPTDTHPLHGEMPVAEMDRAWLRFGEDAGGPWVELGGQCDYVRGFGPHYRAQPRVRLGATDAVFLIEMQVRNLSAHPMELMYMLHANFAFVADAEIHQPAAWTPETTKVRRTVPGHVTPSPEFLALLDDLAVNPARMRRLSEPALYSPEQVFYITGLGTGTGGRTRQVMALPSGDGFTLSHRPADFPHCVRWIFNDGDAQVAAFALPSTCEPEGYTAEKAKGHIRILAPGEELRFPVQLGHLSPEEMPQALAEVAALDQD